MITNSTTSSKIPPLVSVADIAVISSFLHSSFSSHIVVGGGVEVVVGVGVNLVVGGLNVDTHSAGKSSIEFAHDGPLVTESGGFTTSPTAKNEERKLQCYGLAHHTTFHLLAKKFTWY